MYIIPDYREYLLVDPTLSEEAVMDGRLVVGMNVHREICALQMSGGVALLPELVWNIHVPDSRSIYTCTQKFSLDKISPIPPTCTCTVHFIRKGFANAVRVAIFPV